MLQKCKDRCTVFYTQYKSQLFLCLCAVFIFGLIAHAYAFFNHTLTHDGLNAFVATPTEEHWKVELGRFFVPVYRAIFRGAVTLPWLIGLLGLLWLGLAAFVVIRIFDVTDRRIAVLICGAMVINIPMISQLATYLYEFDFNALALLFSVSAAACWRFGKTIVRKLPGCVLLMFSIGIYQSYFTVAATLMCLVCFLDLLQEKDPAQTFYQGFWAAVILVLGCLLYFVVGKLVYSFTGIQPLGRTDVFHVGAYVSNMSFSLLDIAASFARDILHPAYPPIPICIFFFVSFTLLAVQGIRLVAAKRFSFLRLMLLFIFGLCTVVSMAAIYFISASNVHDLMGYSIYFYPCIFLILAQRFSESFPKDRFAGWTKAIVMVLVFCLIWGNTVLANTVYVKKQRDTEAANSTMARAVLMMEQHDDYVAGESVVAWVGDFRTESGFPNAERLSTVTGMNYPIIPHDSTYFFNAYRAYFDYVLQYPITLCTDQQHAQLCADPKVQAMPAFPEEGCMQLVDGVFVIKMGE